MQRTLLIAGIVLAALGASVWFVFPRAFRQPDGAVLGEQRDEPATIPSDAVLLLGGDAYDQLLWWRPETGVRVVQRFVGKSVAAAVMTPNGLVAALRQSRGTLLAVLREPEGTLDPVLALDGNVRQMAAGQGGRFVSILRERNETTELDAVDLLTGRLTRLLERARAAAWLSRISGVLSYDAEGVVRYHGVNVDGAFEAPQELLRSLSPPAVEPQTDRVLFVTPETPSLAAYDVATREQRLILPLQNAYAAASFNLLLSPSGRRAVLAPSASSAGASPLLVDIRSGVSDAVAVSGIVKMWYGEDALVAASSQDGRAILAKIPTGTAEPLGDQNTQPLP